MKAAKVAVAALSALTFASLFLPCVTVYHQTSAPVPPVAVTWLVGTWLLEDAPMPYAVYLLSVPALSLVASVLLLGLRGSARGLMWAGLGGVAYLVLPSLTVPKVKLGALTGWHLSLHPLFTPTRVLYGFYVYTALLGALAVAYLALAVGGWRAGWRAKREAR